MSYTEPAVKPGYVMKWIGVVFATIVIFMLVLVLTLWGFKAFGRSQQRHQLAQDRSQAQLNAKNRVKVSAIEIQNQNQRVQVAKQQAEIRLQNAIGIREAQDQIAKTLTPLYVQFEMTQALQEIAKSGKNSSVIYIPSGAAGVPLIANSDPTQVTRP